MTSLPKSEPLSDEMATAIGHAVASFGHLEEALKRAIFSLTRKGLGEDASDRALHHWLQRMEDIADDSLGTLIESFLSAVKHAKIKDHPILAASLTEIRLKRNLLCHASWKSGEKPGYWHPSFINTKGEHFPDDMNAADIGQIRDLTVRTINEIIQIMRATGIEGELSGEDGKA